MTAPADPARGAGQRVSDAIVEHKCREIEAVGRVYELMTEERALLDLRDERAASASKDAVIADLRAKLAVAEGRYAEQHEIVARIWRILGSPTYADLAGRTIYDLIGGHIDRADALARDLAAMTEARDALKAFASFTWKWCNRPNITDAERVGMIRNHPTLAKFIEPPDDAYRAALTPPAQPTKEERS